jgi:hypothetical protein
MHETVNTSPALRARARAAVRLVVGATKAH